MTHKGITTAVYKDEKVWFFGLLSLLFTIFLLYTYFVISSVVHVVMRKELDHDITAVSSYVSQLEAEYISAQHAVSKEIASHEGFSPVEEKTFISRTPGTLTLRVPNES